MCTQSTKVWDLGLALCWCPSILEIHTRTAVFSGKICTILNKIFGVSNKFLACVENVHMCECVLSVYVSLLPLKTRILLEQLNSSKRIKSKPTVVFIG